MEFITIKTFNTEAEDYLLLNFLESNGIQAFIFNAHTSSVYPVFNQTIGGVIVTVKKEDESEGIRLSNRFYN